MFYNKAAKCNQQSYTSIKEKETGSCKDIKHLRKVNITVCLSEIECFVWVLQYFTDVITTG